MPELKHENFTYPPNQIDKWGAVKGCTCKACEAHRQNKMKEHNYV